MKCQILNVLINRFWTSYIYICPKMNRKTRVKSEAEAEERKLGETCLLDVSPGRMNQLDLLCSPGSLRWMVFLGPESITALLC